MVFAKKTLGQHFLRSAGALQKIVGAAQLLPADTVLEVGPGEGVLTELLLKQAGKVIAVEKDDRLIPVLEQKFAAEIASGEFELIHADILEFSIFNFQRSPTKSWRICRITLRDNFCGNFSKGQSVRHTQWSCSYKKKWHGE